MSSSKKLRISKRNKEDTCSTRFVADEIRLNFHIVTAGAIIERICEEEAIASAFRDTQTEMALGAIWKNVDAFAVPDASSHMVCARFKL